MEMQKMVHLGISKQDMFSILLTHNCNCWKDYNSKRIITDFMFLNSRLQRVNLAFLLIRDTFAILESSKCECFSVLDLKDAYHPIILSEMSKPYRTYFSLFWFILLCIPKKAYGTK